MIRRLYETYDRWHGQWRFACRRGCAFCCTGSVTLTTLEGRLIVDHLRQRGELAAVIEALRDTAGSTPAPACTTNEYARACLAGGIEPPASGPARDFSPCRFLAGNQCTIYEVRPFGCRCFASRKHCGENGAAEVPPLLVTVNTVFLQLLEHLDRAGGCWGCLDAVLLALTVAEGAQEKRGVRAARPLPGFLVPPGEEDEVNRLLEDVWESDIAGYSFGWLIDNLYAME